MSYYNFRNVSGADNLIDYNEFSELTRQKYPYLDPISLNEIAREKFALTDRDASGRINYNEFVDANYRNYMNPVNYPQTFAPSALPMYGPALAPYQPIFGPQSFYYHPSYARF
ncbi:unnamed protein product [Brachionus calyciflorus]|uniref:EF-hand domain-containing protein n=1 Tax=Brachionus calyciflorus TaxID=104777 RepID=A0A813TRT3_9BILA|nr:unnamed protein product [Brachionus calyciflorus]